MNPNERTRKTPEYLLYDKISWYFRADARARLDRGDIGGELSDLENLLQMDRHSSPYATALLNIEVLTEESLTLRMLLQTLTRHYREENVLDRVEQIAHEVCLPDLYKVIQTEFVLGRTSIYRIKSLEELGLDKNTPKTVSKTFDSLYEAPGVREAFDAKFVKLYLKFFEDLPTDRQDWLSIYRALTKERKAIDSDWSIDSGISRMIAPAFPWLALNEASVQARQRILLAAISLFRDRIATGSFPDKLPPLGQNSIDPLSGKPLHYRRETNGFIVYSVGQNMKDDGGRPAVGPNGVRQGDDIVYRYTNHPSFFRPVSR